MSVGGVVLIDLTDCPRERWRHRVASLPEVPAGGRVLVLVGALAVEPHTARLLCEHTERLAITVMGTVFAMTRWTEALTTGHPLGWLE